MTKKSRTNSNTEVETSLLASESDGQIQNSDCYCNKSKKTFTYSRMYNGVRHPPTNTSLVNCDQSTVVTGVGAGANTSGSVGIGVDNETVLDEIRPNLPFAANHRIVSGISSAHSAGAYTPSSFDAVSSDCSRTQLLGSHHHYSFMHSVRSSCLHLPLDAVNDMTHTPAASWCFEMCHQNESSFAEPALQALLTRYFANSQRRCLLCFIGVLCSLSTLLGTLELYYSASLTQRVVYFYAHAIVTLGFTAFLRPGCGTPRRDLAARFGRNRLCTDLFMSVVLAFHSIIFIILNLPVSFASNLATLNSVGNAVVTTVPPTTTTTSASSIFSPSNVSATLPSPSLLQTPSQSVSSAPQTPLFTLVDGFWQVLVVTVLLFLFLPLRFYVPLFVATSITTLHTVIAFVFANRMPELMWRFVLANLMIASCIIGVCTWLNIRVEQLQRNVFVHAKSCAESRICLQNAQDRCERLLQVSFPERIASQLTKACIAFGDTSPEKRFAQKRIPSCTFLMVDIVGISQLLASHPPMEFLRIINCLITAFDLISQQFRCYRLRLLGSSYFAICGVPDSAPDHALCAVQAAFGYVAAVKQFADETGVKLSVKVVLHSTTSAICGVFGVRRMAFDVWCNDVELLNEMRLYVPASQIAVSKPMADMLSGLFTLEPINFRRLRTYRPDHQPTVGDQQVLFLVKQRAVPARKFTLPQRYFFNAIRGVARRSSLVDAAMGVQQQQPRSHGHGHGVVHPGLAMAFGGTMQPHVSQSEDQFQDITEMLLSNTTTANNSVVDTREGSLHARLAVAGDPFGIASQFNLSVNDNLLVHFNHALKLQSLGKMRRSHTGRCSLSFLSSDREKKYQSLPDEHFDKSLLFALIIVICNAAQQAAVLPKTLLLLFLVLIALAWNSVSLIILFAAKLRCISVDLRRSKAARLTILIISTAIFFAICEVNMMYCRNDVSASEAIVSTSFPKLNGTDDKVQCPVPAYLYTNCVFACLLLAVFTEVSTVVKFTLLGTISVIYLMTVSLVHFRLINDFDERFKVLVPTSIQGVILNVLLLVLFTMHSARIEWYRRAQFIWSTQMDEAIQSSTVLHHKLTDAMYNLMPESSFAEYLDGRLRNSAELYCVTHKRVATGFVQICGLDSLPDSDPNSSSNNNGPAPLTPLNAGALLDTIFTTFDTILALEKFRLVEKVKNVGPLYQLSVGLQLENFSDEELPQMFAPYLVLLLELLSEFASVLENVSFAHQIRLSLKCGLGVGPIFAGVIGGKRIQYELFGESVLQAFGLVNHAAAREVLCSEDVMQLLQPHYDFDAVRELPAMSTNKKQILAFRLRGVRRIQMNLQTDNASAVFGAVQSARADGGLPVNADQKSNSNSNVETQLWQTQQQVMAAFHSSYRSAQLPPQQLELQPTDAQQNVANSAGSHAGSHKKRHHHHKHRQSSKAHDNPALVKSPSGELIQLNVFSSNLDSVAPVSEPQPPIILPQLLSCANSVAGSSSKQVESKLSPVMAQRMQHADSLVSNRSNLTGSANFEQSGIGGLTPPLPRAVPERVALHNGFAQESEVTLAPAAPVKTRPAVKPRTYSTNSSQSAHSQTPVSVIASSDRQLSLAAQPSSSGKSKDATISEEVLDFPSYRPPAAPFAARAASVKQSAEKPPQSQPSNSNSISISNSSVRSPVQTISQAKEVETDFSALLRKMGEGKSEVDPAMRESRISMFTEDRETDLESAAEDNDLQQLQAVNTTSAYESNVELDSDVENCKPSSEVSNSDEDERNINNFYVSDYEPDLPSKRLNLVGESRRKSLRDAASTAPKTGVTADDNKKSAEEAQTIVVNRFAEPRVGGVSKKIQHMKMAAQMGKQGAMPAGSCTSTLYGSSNDRSEYENLDSDFSDRVRIETDVLERLRRTHRELQAATASGGIDFDFDVDLELTEGDGDGDGDGYDPQQLPEAVSNQMIANWLPDTRQSAAMNRSGIASDYDNNNNNNGGTGACATGTSSVTSTAHRNSARQRMLQKLGLSRRLSSDTTDDDERHDMPTTTDEESEYVSELDQANTTADEYDGGNTTDDYMTYSAIFNKLRSANLIKSSSTVGSASASSAVRRQGSSDSQNRNSAARK